MERLGERVYPYKIKWVPIVLGILMFGGAGAFFAMRGLGNNQGLALLGIIDLSPSGATIFYWAMATAGIGLALTCMIIALQRLRVSQHISLTTEAIRVPKGMWSSQDREIPFKTIRSTATQNVFGEQILVIEHAEGTTKLAASQLPEPGALDEILQWIRDQSDRKLA